MPIKGQHDPLETALVEDNASKAFRALTDMASMCIPYHCQSAPSSQPGPGIGCKTATWCLDQSQTLASLHRSDLQSLSSVILTILSLVCKTISHAGRAK